MLHYTRLERLARDKHSSLLGPFVSYEEKVVLIIRLETDKTFYDHNYVAKLH